jgi:hypothetical protein
VNVLDFLKENMFIVSHILINFLGIMDELYKNFKYSIDHLETLHKTFVAESNFSDNERLDFLLYQKNLEKFSQTISTLEIDKQLYDQKGRQMILADILEYIFLGRGYYAIKNLDDKQRFTKSILYFVNLLMCYESMTKSSNIRKNFLTQLKLKIPQIETEGYFSELLNFQGSVGLKRGDSDAPDHLNNYFDTFLPKTAGGLWHELLVFIFLLRNDIGYIVPLLLNQRLLGLKDNLVPPDFLIISHDKRIYGVEVGRKKEIQSGSFSLKTAIPTASIDTENSRSSDRCPICKRWIPFCDFVIKNYSDFEYKFEKIEVRCLEKCTIFPKEDIKKGLCPYTKYSRNHARTLEYANHRYADGLHYHYQCVLTSVDQNTRDKLIAGNDIIALKTHYPYYAGLDDLMLKR